MKKLLIVSFIILLGFAQFGNAERIKDIIDIQGVRGTPYRV